jgi:hypothetical protein
MIGLPIGLSTGLGSYTFLYLLRGPHIKVPPALIFSRSILPYSIAGVPK